MAAVDTQGLPGDVTGGRADQERDGRPDVALRVTNPSERHPP